MILLNISRIKRQIPLSVNDKVRAETGWNWSSKFC